MQTEDLQRVTGGNPVFGAITGAPYRLTSIADLKAIDVRTVANGQVVELLGYVTAGDGGGGLFTYSNSSTSSDNGGTVIAPTAGAGRWLRTIVGSISIVCFGAKCDGVTDDHAAINNALAAAGAVLIPPAATTLISGALVMPSNSSITGAGPGSTILVGAAIGILAASATGIKLTNLTIAGSGILCAQLLSLSTVDNVAVRYVTFTGAGKASASLRAAISLRNVTNCWIEDCIFYGNGDGSAGGFDIVANYNAGGCSFVHMLRNRHHDSTNDTTIGMFDTRDSEVVGCDINQNNFLVNPAASGYAVLFYTTVLADATTCCLRNKVSGNSIQNTAGSAVYIQGGSYSSVEGNYLYDTCKQQTDGSLPVGAVAINAGNTASLITTQAIVARNIIVTSGKNGMSIANTDSILIDGNQISGTTKAGIFFGGNDTKARVVNNRVLAPVTDGLLFATSGLSGIVVEHNDFLNSSGGFGINDNGTTSSIFRFNNLYGNSSGPYAFTHAVLTEGNLTTATGVLRGTAQLSGGTVTVSSAEIRAGDTVRIYRQVTGGTLGNLSLGTINAATSFVINSSGGSDTSYVGWEIVH